MSFEEAGGPALFGVALAVPIALIVAYVFTEAVESESVMLGLSVTGFLSAAFILPLNLHMLGNPTSQLALTLDFAVVMSAGVVGAIMGGIFGRLKLFLPLLAVGTVVGWGLAWPKLGIPERTWPVATADAPGGPIVLVVVDTLRADHLGLYGYDRPTSPSLDAWARNAVVYEDAAATSSWTLPSVATLMTGLRPSHHGGGVNDGVSNLQTTIRADVPTVAERLRDSGYATAAVVTNPWLAASYGFQRGFGTYDDVIGPCPMPVGLHPIMALHLDPLQWPVYRSADRITDTALDFVGQQPSGRWFLMVHYMDVHGPHTAPAEDVEALGKGNLGEFVDAYDASIHFFDRELGRLLAGLPEDATVVLVSDHGEQLIEKRALPGPVPPNTRHGHTLYQELLRVPLIVKGPGITGRRVKQSVSLVDVAPTLLELAGVSALESADGVPLAEVFGRKGEPEPQVASSLRYGAEQQSARSGDYKLHVQKGGRHTLYNLADDPGEVREIVSSEPLYGEIEPELKALLPAIGGAVHGAPVPVGRQMLELLERLGYVDPAPVPVPEEAAAKPEPVKTGGAFEKAKPVGK